MAGGQLVPPPKDEKGMALPQDLPDVRGYHQGLPETLDWKSFMENEGSTYYWYYRNLLTLMNWSPCPSDNGDKDKGLPLPRGWEGVEYYDLPQPPNINESLPFGVLIKPDPEATAWRRHSCKTWYSNAAKSLPQFHVASVAAEPTLLLDSFYGTENPDAKRGQPMPQPLLSKQLPGMHRKPSASAVEPQLPGQTPRRPSQQPQLRPDAPQQAQGPAQPRLAPRRPPQQPEQRPVEPLLPGMTRRPSRQQPLQRPVEPQQPVMAPQRPPQQAEQRPAAPLLPGMTRRSRPQPELPAEEPQQPRTAPQWPPKQAKPQQPLFPPKKLPGAGRVAPQPNIKQPLMPGTTPTPAQQQPAPSEAVAAPVPNTPSTESPKETQNPPQLPGVHRMPGSAQVPPVKAGDADKGAQVPPVAAGDANKGAQEAPVKAGDADKAAQAPPANAGDAQPQKPVWPPKFPGAGRQAPTVPQPNIRQPVVHAPTPTPGQQQPAPSEAVAAPLPTPPSTEGPKETQTPPQLPGVHRMPGSAQVPPVDADDKKTDGSGPKDTQDQAQLPPVKAEDKEQSVLPPGQDQFWSMAPEQPSVVTPPTQGDKSTTPSVPQPRQVGGDWRKEVELPEEQQQPTVMPTPPRYEEYDAELPPREDPDPEYGHSYYGPTYGPDENPDEGYQWVQERYDEGYEYTCGEHDSEGTSPHMVLLLRGSISESEFGLDAAYNQVSKPEYGPGKIHAGAYYAAEAVWLGGLKRAIQREIMNGCRSITIAGYSLGAAVAQLLAIRAEALLSYAWSDHIRLRGASPSPVTVVAFGSYQVGDAEWAENFNKKINARNIAFEADLITKVPCTPQMTGCPAPPAPVNTLSPDGVWFYQRTGANIVYPASEMPFSSKYNPAQSWSSLLTLTGEKACSPAFVPFSVAGHFCSYLCLTGQYIGAHNNMCWLDPQTTPAEGATLCNWNGNMQRIAGPREIPPMPKFTMEVTS